MDITDEMHIADEISSNAEVETIDTYKDRIPYYASQDYTYIPIPSEEKYFNTEEGWMKEIDDSQYISPECHLIEALEYLQELPFLLIDSEHNKFVFINTENNQIVDDMRLAAPNKRMSKEYVVDTIRENDNRYYNNAEDYLDSENVEITTLEEAIDRLSDYSELNYTEYQNRYRIVTVSDINKRQMKDMLYRLFAELVSSLGEKIEKEYPDSNSILKHLRPDTIGRWKKEQIEGLNIHISEHLNLIDILGVVQASDKQFVKECGFDSKDDVSVLSSINDVRNSVMHANRSLVYSRRDIEDVLEAVENAQRIISEME